MAACRDEAAGAPAGEPRYPAVMAAFDQVVTATASDADWDAVEALAYGRWDAAARARGERGAAVRRGGGGGVPGPGGLRPGGDEHGAGGAGRAGAAARRGTGGGRRPAVAAAVAAAGLFPKGASVAQPGGGHFAWLDNRDGFARTVSVLTGWAVLSG